MALGLDYAWQHPDEASLVRAGVTFVGRYLSADSSKRIHKPEADRHLAAGRSIVLVYEDTERLLLGGFASGVAHAQVALSQAHDAGLDGAPIYYAADWDATPDDQHAIDAFLDGAASVHGLARTGLYAGFWPCSRARTNRKAAYLWGTVAWSGTNWRTASWKPHIMQGATVILGGASCDWDTSNAADFGQYKAPAKPAQNWTEILVDTLPTLNAGTTGDDVRTVQALLVARGHDVAVDGDYGTATHAAVFDLQRRAGIGTDGTVGPATWKVLLHR